MPIARASFVSAAFASARFIADTNNTARAYLCVDEHFLGRKRRLPVEFR